jgi:hypothetical protein
MKPSCWRLPSSAAKPSCRNHGVGVGANEGNVGFWSEVGGQPERQRPGQVVSADVVHAVLNETSCWLA